jgi:hypothetical protein
MTILNLSYTLDRPLTPAEREELAGLLAAEIGPDLRVDVDELDGFGMSGEDVAISIAISLGASIGANLATPALAELARRLSARFFARRDIRAEERDGPEDGDG